MTVRINNALADTMLNGGVRNAFGSYGLKLYTGTQPTTAGGTHSDTLLVTLTLAGTNVPVAGVSAVDIGAMTLPVTPVANGTIGWGRLENGSNVLDLTVTDTAGGGDLEMNNRSVTTSDSVDMNNMNFNQPKG